VSNLQCIELYHFHILGIANIPASVFTSLLQVHYYGYYFLFVLSFLSLVLHYGTSCNFPTPISKVVSIQYFHANET
jgi:hypothetical protein